MKVFFIEKWKRLDLSIKWTNKSCYISILKYHSTAQSTTCLHVNTDLPQKQIWNEKE